MYKTIKLEVIENLNEQLTDYPENPVDLYWFTIEALLGKFNLASIPKLLNI